MSRNESQRRFRIVRKLRAFGWAGSSRRCTTEELESQLKELNEALNPKCVFCGRIHRSPATVAACPKRLAASREAKKYLPNRFGAPKYCKPPLLEQILWLAKNIPPDPPEVPRWARQRRAMRIKSSSITASEKPAGDNPTPETHSEEITA